MSENFDLPVAQEKDIGSKSWTDHRGIYTSTNKPLLTQSSAADDDVSCVLLLLYIYLSDNITKLYFSFNSHPILILNPLTDVHNTLSSEGEANNSL